MVQPGAQQHRHLRPQRLGGVAGPLGMGDQPAHPLGRSGAAHLQPQGHLFQGPHRRREPELLRGAEAATGVGDGLVDLDLV
jgi:hypothetical protein